MVKKSRFAQRTKSVCSRKSTPWPVLREPVQDHEVLQIVLINGETYAIDLSGPQFGHYGEPVIPWTSYRAFCVREIIKTSGLTHKEGAMLHGRRVAGHQGTLWTIYAAFAKQLNYAVQEWEEANIQLKVLLMSSNKDFTKGQRELVDNIQKYLLGYKTHLESKGSN